MKTQQLSIIIPCYNAQSTITQTIKQIVAHQKYNNEIIIVDSSPHNTVRDLIKAISYSQLTYVKVKKRGRALQMNLGADKASTQHLFFLHADTLVPKHFDTEIIKILKSYDYGGFRKKFYPSSIILTMNQLIKNTSISFTKEILGDNGFFVRKDVFKKINGFPALPLMEDIAISRILRKKHAFNIARLYVHTSAEKILAYGQVKYFALTIKLRFLYNMGYDIQKIARMYT